MANLGDFSSLLQLGVGTGIGLSIFRVPIDIGLSRLKAPLEAEMELVACSTTAFGKAKWGKLCDLSLDFDSKAGTLVSKVQAPFMVLALVGAFVNTYFLISAAFDSSQSVGQSFRWWLVFCSVGYYLLLLIILQAIVYWKLADLAERLKRIQSETAGTITPE